MSRIILDNNQIMDYELLAENGEQIQKPYLLIYFVLKGSLTIWQSEAVTEVNEKEFMLLNPFRIHSVDIHDSSLGMVFAVNLNVISEYYDISKMDFEGHSVGEASERCLTLLSLLEQCVSFYYGKNVGEGRIFMKLNSLYYQIVELLVTSFSIIKNSSMLHDKEQSDEEWLREMLRYIYMNYQMPLHLEDLADHFYLSTAYVSRYFKKKLGINFVKYLTGIRLDYAVKELENTDWSLTRIAMDCGFSNLAAFNKAFKERYKMNPKQYRNSLHREENPDNKENGKKDNSAEIRLFDYLNDNEILNRLEGVQENLIEQLDITCDNQMVLNKTWNRMINIGGISLLLKREIQNHILFLCKELGFEYVRVWDIYAPDIHLNIASETRKYNFSNIDSCLDFLIENHLTPYIELGFKPFVLVKRYEIFDVIEEREISLTEAKDFGKFVRQLMRHLLNRYGTKEVSKWIFELWCDPRWFIEGDPSVYIEYFEEVYQNIKDLSPQTRVGGDYDRSYDKMIVFETLIEKWSLRNIQPDFVSIYCYPPMYAETEMDASGQKQVNFMKKYVRRKKGVMKKYGMQMPMHISEWNFTVVNANVINDSRVKGAYLMKTIMEIYDDVDMMGYWLGTDLFVEDDEAPLLLNGRCGLITHQRICKPSFWGMSFLNHLEEYLIEKTENVMVTMNKFDSYVIACHNYKELGIQYQVQAEKDILIESIPHLYEDHRRRIIKITINGANNGLYYVKTRFVNSKYGSVQDEWE